MEETLICRLCLSTNVKLLNIFKYCLHTAYATLTGVEIDPTDDLPPYICNICSALLIKSTTFQKMCTDSQNLLVYALKQQVLSTKYIQNLKITSPFTFSTIINEQINCVQIHNIKEEVCDWDYEDDFKVKETESSDEEPLSTKVNKPEVIEEKVDIKTEEIFEKQPKVYDDDFPNGEVDEMILTKEQQIEEVQSRKTSTNYMNSVYKCEKCYKGFVTDATYKNHMARHDPSSGVFECEICHIRLTHMRALKAHVMTSHERKFVCKLCNHISKSRHRAKEHSKWHIGHTFICKFCGASFSKSTSHLTHIRLHHPSKHACHMCGESFIGVNGLNMHIKKTHRDVQNPDSDSDTRCSNCDTLFNNLDALKRHMKDAVDGSCDPDLRPCAQCGEGFSTEDELKKHLKVHSKDEPVKCEECNRVFAHERSYSVHYQRVHLKKRAPRKSHYKPQNVHVVCEICGRECTSNASLRYHQRIHTGERPYACTVCPKKFSQPQRLQIHQRTHTGERPFACALCPKAFKHKAALNRHNRVHTGAKPYACSHCGKSFSQSNSMKVHIRTVHLKLPSLYRARRPAAE